MTRQNIHFVTSKSINNQKKVNDTLERVILTQGRSQPKIPGGGQNFIDLSSGAPRIKQEGAEPGCGGRAPSRHEFLGFLHEKHSFQQSFLSKKNSLVPSSGLNPCVGSRLTLLH